MKSMRLKAAVRLACIAVLLVATNAQAKDKWINLTTKNFNIVSNAGEGETRRLALRLEQFHFVFSKLFNLPMERAVPVTVMVFKHDDSFKPYKPLYNGKPANLAGYFQGGEDENLIAVNISAHQDRPMSLIYHEYTHLLTSVTPRQWPIWLKEGLAELYSSFEVDDKKVTLGAPISRHVMLLREKSFIPLQDLLNVRHGSPIYSERDKQGIFYAQSWALCHYLMFGDKNVRQPQMSEFSQLINRGVANDVAFAQAFKVSPAEMEKQIRSYVGRSTYTVNIYTLASTEGEKEIAVRPISDGESQFYLGNLLARTMRLDEAEVHFKQAVELEPDLPRPYEGLGFVALRRTNFPEALEHFKQAATRGSKNHLAHYYYADALRRQASGAISPEVAKKIAEELRISIKLMPGFAYSHAALGFLSLVTGENFKEGADSLKTAIRLAPQNKHLLLNLASIQIRMRDYDAAKKTLEPLLTADTEPGLKTSAEMNLKMIEYAMRPAPVLRETDRPLTSSDRSEDSVRPASDESAPPRLVRRPTLKIEGAQTIRGVLVTIECKAGKWTLVVNTKDDLLRFSVSDKDKLEFYSQDPQVDGQVNCGSVNKIAFIYYKQVPGQSKLAGDAVAVEFTQ